MKRPYLLCLAATVGVATTNTFLRVLGGSDAVTAAAAAAGAASSDAGSKSLFVWWEMLTHGDARTLLDPRWWYHYILAEFEAEPAHALVETICILTILYLLVWRKPAPLPQEKLTKKEEEELIAEWKPAPLCPEWVPSAKQRFIVESGTGRTIVANGGKTYLNFASTNFLGLADRPETKAACRDTIEKYGVGSCGPRGFYGTFDVHLAIEAALAKFLHAEECILYSDSLASISSVIPAFAKKGDTIVVDDSVAFGIQQGCLLSRSTIYYYQHGDMASLERVLETIAAKEASNTSSKRVLAHRKFIVVEGVSSVYGDIVPLKRVCELKAKYGYRLIVDDSLGFGVLGKTGRGTMEHHGLAMQQPHGPPGVDILCVSMDHTMASVGGFCVGNHQVVDHQRLSGAGYCFSASSPPYTSTASLETLAVIEDQGTALTATLRKKAAKVRRALANVHKNLAVLGEGDSDESPSIHLALKNADASRLTLERAQFEKMNDYLRDDAGIITSVPEFIPADKNRAKPTLRILLSTLHTDADLEKLVKAVGQAANKALR